MHISYSNGQLNGKKAVIGATQLDPAQPVRLLIGFHGAESTPENILVHGNKLRLGNTVHIFPEGPIDAQKGLWSWWQDGPRQAASIAAFLDYTRGLVDAARALAQRMSPGAPLQTCLWGFSQGGAAALVYALLGGHDLHKVAAVCGFLPELESLPARSAKVTQVLGIYGANDDVVPSFLAEHALDEAGRLGHATTAKETAQGHELTADNLAALGQFFSA